MSNAVSRFALKRAGQIPRQTITPEVAKLLKEMPTKVVSTADSVIFRRASQLKKTNVAVVFPSDPKKLLEIAKSGKFQTDEAALAFRNVTQNVQEKGGFSAFILSDKGKKALASEASIDDLLAKGIKGIPGRNGQESNSFDVGLRFGSQAQVSRAVSLQDDVQNVLIDAKDFDAFMGSYGAAVTKGEAPATLAGKPFTEFFRATDDLYNDLEVESFKRVLPSFSQKPIEEQKAIAALAGRVAADMPEGVSEETRRKVAAALVSHKQVAGSPTGEAAVGELKQFYHGTRAADLIAQNGFKVGDGAVYGRGIYFSNPTASSGYSYARPSSPAQIVSGKVDVGKVTSDPFRKAKDADTRMVPRDKLKSPDSGDYWVTQDPKRFTIKAITTYDPAAKSGLEGVIPELLEAYPKAPKWSSELLERVDPTRTKKAYEHALKSLDTNTRQAAGILLAREGHPQGVSIALKALKDAPTPELRHSAYEALSQGVKVMDPQAAAPIREALAAMPVIDPSASAASPLQRVVNWFKKVFSE
jgi:hypothetical protein